MLSPFDQVVCEDELGDSRPDSNQKNSKASRECSRCCIPALRVEKEVLTFPNIFPLGTRGTASLGPATG